MNEYYKILGLNGGENLDIIRNKYRELTKIYSRNKDRESQIKYQKINEAYNILKDNFKEKKSDMINVSQDYKEITKNVSITPHEDFIELMDDFDVTKFNEKYEKANSNKLSKKRLNMTSDEFINERNNIDKELGNVPNLFEGKNSFDNSKFFKLYDYFNKKNEQNSTGIDIETAHNNNNYYSIKQNKSSDVNINENYVPINYSLDKNLIETIKSDPVKINERHRSYYDKSVDFDKKIEHLKKIISNPPTKYEDYSLPEDDDKLVQPILSSYSPVNLNKSNINIRTQEIYKPPQQTEHNFQNIPDSRIYYNQSQQNRLNQQNQLNQPNQLNQVNQVNQSNKSNQVNQTNQSNQVNQNTFINYKYL